MIWCRALELMKHLHLSSHMGKHEDISPNMLFIFPYQCPEKEDLDTEVEDLKE